VNHGKGSRDSLRIRKIGTEGAPHKLIDRSKNNSVNKKMSDNKSKEKLGM